jgi:glycosyltransferase involved in cell wall biosynthesis
MEISGRPVRSFSGRFARPHQSEGSRAGRGGTAARSGKTSSLLQAVVDTLPSTGHHPAFSVCVPAYDNIQVLERALASVLAQDIKELECIISDDSSTDAVQEHVAGLNDPRIRYVKNKPPLGAPRNWNAALAQARGDIVTLLHHDDWYRTPTTLRALQEFMEETGADTVFCGRSLYVDGLPVGEYTDVVSALETFSASFPSQSLIVNRLGHPSVLFFRNTLTLVAYDEGLRYFSDTEYYYRLLREAARPRGLPRALVALERTAADRLSDRCLQAPEALVDELVYALEKHRASSLGKGLAAARFLASNARNFSPAGAMSCARRLCLRLGAAACSIICAALPVFLGHMLYRALYRKAVGKPWG